IGVLAIPVLGLLVTLGIGESLYGQPFEAALLAVGSMAVAVMLVLTTGHALDRIDAARTASERALADREERLRDLIEKASDGVFIADLDGRYTEVNDAACKMLGYDREEIVGKTIMEFLPEKELPRLHAAKTALLAGSTLVEEWTIRRRDNTYL